MNRKKPTVEVFQRADKRWDWHIKGANGEVMAGSVQGYDYKSDALEGFLRTQDAMEYIAEVRYT